MNKDRILVFAIFLLLVFVPVATALEPLVMDWDLSEFVEGENEYSIVSTSSEGLTLYVKKPVYVPLWQELPKKSRYLSCFKLSSLVSDLQSGSCGLAISGREYGPFLYVGPSTAVISIGGPKGTRRLKTAKVQNFQLPVTITLVYDTKSGQVEGFLDDQKIIEANFREAPGVPAVTSISYVGIFASGQSCKATFKTLDLEAK